MAEESLVSATECGFRFITNGPAGVADPQRAFGQQVTGQTQAKLVAVTQGGLPYEGDKSAQKLDRDMPAVAARTSIVSAWAGCAWIDFKTRAIRASANPPSQLDACPR